MTHVIEMCDGGMTPPRTSTGRGEVRGLVKPAIHECGSRMHEWTFALVSLATALQNEWVNPHAHAATLGRGGEPAIIFVHSCDIRGRSSQGRDVLLREIGTQLFIPLVFVLLNPIDLYTD